LISLLWPIKCDILCNVRTKDTVNITSTSIFSRKSNASSTDFRFIPLLGRIPLTTHSAWFHQRYKENAMVGGELTLDDISGVGYYKERKIRFARRYGVTGLRDNLSNKYVT
jgi:hypothetical protein